MLGIIVSIASAACKIVSTIKSIGLTLSGLELIGRIITAIAKVLGLVEDENIEAEELGEKALQAEAEGIKPENYETYKDYVKAIESFELDPEKSKLWTSEEKVLKGTELSSALLIEKYGPEVQNLIMEVARNPEFFNTQRLKLYLDTLSDNGIGFGDITDYLSGNTKNRESREAIRSIMLEVEKEINPEISDADAQRLINGQKH